MPKVGYIRSCTTFAEVLQHTNTSGLKMGHGKEGSTKAEQHTYGTFSQLHSTKAQEVNGIEGDINAVWIVGEGDQAVDTICEGGDLCLCDEVKVLSDNLLNGLKCKSDNCGLFIACRCCEDHEHGLPA